MRMTGYLLTATIVWLSCLSPTTIDGATATSEKSESRSAESHIKDTATNPQAELDCDYQRTILCHPRLRTNRAEGPRVKRSADDQSSPPAVSDDDEQTRSTRSNLNDRNSLHQGRNVNSLRSKLRRYSRAKGGLERNFLRFGRRSDQQRPDDDDDADNEDASVASSSDHLLERLLDGLRTAAATEIAEDVDIRDSNSNDESAVDAYNVMIKRGSLNRNFIRYGRFRPHRPISMFNDKRGSLDRNFLRFGKRNHELNSNASYGSDGTSPSSSSSDDGNNGSKNTDDDDADSRAKSSSDDNLIVSI